MHVDAVAKALCRDHRREACPVSLAPGDGAHELAHHECPVGGSKAERRPAVHFVLAGPAFRLEGFRLETCRTQRGDQHGAEAERLLVGDDAVVGSGPLQPLHQVELLLEGNHQPEPERAF